MPEALNPATFKKKPRYITPPENIVQSSDAPKSASEELINKF